MTLEFIKHDRPVNAHDLQKYGRYATHDIKVPILLAYELGKRFDANGTVVDVNKEWLEATMRKSNAFIKNKHESPFGKLKTTMMGPIENAEIIPLIKDHDAKKVNGQIGYSEGLLYTQEIDGVTGLFVNGVIHSMEAKRVMESEGLLRAVSLATRGDGSIKEISFVVNECLPHAGPIFSEKTADSVIPAEEPKPEVQLSEQQVQLIEEISALEFQEVELTEVIIPNHLILSKLIKTGRLQPWKYEELIGTRNIEFLEFMETASVGADLGVMFGTFKPPVDLQDNTDQLINNIVAKYKEKKAGAQGKTQKSDVKFAESDPLISHCVSPSERRTKELKNILELMEHNPEVASKFIRIELGEEVEAPNYNDKYLNEYLNEAKGLQAKIKNLKIQLGEYNE